MYFPTYGLWLFALLTVASDYPFVCGYLLKCHGTAGMEFLGGDSDLGSESELRSVGK